MGWLVSFAVGAVAGLASSAVVPYTCFSPASDSSEIATRGGSVDVDYRSRLDAALEEAAACGRGAGSGFAGGVSQQPKKQAKIAAACRTVTYRSYG